MREGSGRISSFFHDATPQRQVSPLLLAPGLKDKRLTHAAPQFSPSCSFLLGLPVATICEPQINSKKFLRNPSAPSRGSCSCRLRVCLCSSVWPPPPLLPSPLVVCLLFSFDLQLYRALSLQQHVITLYGAFPTDSMMSGDSVRCIYNLSQAGGQSNTSLAN